MTIARFAPLLLAAATAACASRPPAPSPAPTAPAGRQVLIPRGPQSLAPYSAAVRAGDVVFLAGTLGSVPGGRGLAEGVGGQTRQALENIRANLERIGLGLADLVKCTVFLVDIADYGAMNEAYGPFFAEIDPPARSAVAVAGLPANALVEIECMAAAR